MLNIGVDLGGTNIAIAIVTEEGKILRQGSTPTMRERGYTEIVADMAKLCKELLAAEGLTEADVHSVGIGSPGTCNPESGVVEYANNLTFKDTPIRAEFQKHLDLPVFIGNDANVAAYGEFMSGAGKMYKDLIAITLGTGVGGGIILDGKLVCGSFNGGAELGHTVIHSHGEQCSCGRKGCWEAYSSATALIREASDAAVANPDSTLNTLVKGDVSNMNAKIPFDAAQAGDAVAIGVVDNYIENLAIGLVNVINIFQPEVIVLGGGVSAQKENLIRPLKEKMIHEIYGGAEMLKTEIKVAELGNDAGIIGAAMLYQLYD